MNYDIIIFLVACFIFFASGIRIVNQYEKGVTLTLGKFTGIKEPGFRFVVPFFQMMKRVDVRTKTADVPAQEAITKDNIPIQINAVVYYKIKDAAKSILEVENYIYAVSQLAQTTMRNAVGEQSLDDLLSKRNKVSDMIKEVLDVKTDPWGIDVEILELKDVIIPDDLKRTISKEAEAEREKRAVIIKAEGDKIAADNLTAAAAKLGSTPGAMHLRTLQAINDLSSDQSNTTIWMLPVDILDAINSIKGTNTFNVKNKDKK
jgi:regulator of protease activity HflC (stomatin/prohibitin superfamily)